jgi:hypothetical protein
MAMTETVTALPTVDACLGQQDSRLILRRLCSCLGGRQVGMYRSREGIVLRRLHPFAIVWDPAPDESAYFPIRVTLFMGRRVRSSRVRATEQKTARGWLYHVDVAGLGDVDDELLGWLSEACASAG